MLNLSRIINHWFSQGLLAYAVIASTAVLQAEPIDANSASAWPQADPAAVARWQALRFGMFIHWGPVSLTGHEIGWSRGDQTPVEIYDSLYQKFNPTNFNADEWVSIAKAAGMKYIVLTTKHHDGFCLWDTKLTDYNIMHTPFGRDVVKELSIACRKQGLAFGAYYSTCDWYNTNWPATSPGGSVKRAKSDLDAYEKYLQGQVAELVTNYGPLLTIWNDVPNYKGVDYGKRGADTIKLVRSLQPDILINNRTGDGGDYETPEQRIGKFQMDRPWESCMTVSAHDAWAWGGAQDGVKPLAACLQMIVRGAGGDGNVLLNVGPRPDGMIDPAQATLLKAVGAWLEKNGESIYGTRGGPWKPTKDIVSTRTGNTIYLHIMKSENGRVKLPALPVPIKSATRLNGAEARFTQKDGTLALEIPAGSLDAIDTVVKLEVGRPALAIEPINTPVQPLADGVLQLDAREATIHGKTAQFMSEAPEAIGYWTDSADYLSWAFTLDKPGDFVVELKYAAAPGTAGTTFDIEVGGQKLSSRIAEDTGSWYDYAVVKLGDSKLTNAGSQTITLKPTKKPGFAVMNLAWLRFIPANDYSNYLARTAAEHKLQPVKLPTQAFVVPNFHPASCGWLANWSVERNYCANSYLNHLDRVRDDANYGFVLSECNNMIAIQNFQPERFAELKHRVAEGRVELVNAFFLEPTINLSGGEALAKMGIEGLRWQQQVMGVRPRYCWAIDVCGTHAQMPQICDLLGLDALIYTRCNRSGKTVFWSESPDGSRILTLVPGHYSEDLGGTYAAQQPLSDNQLQKVAKAISSKLSSTPAGAPILILGGQGDYALAPARHENPTEFLESWKKFRPDCEIHYTSLSPYVDALLPSVKSGKIELPTVRTGTSYTFDSFWIENPRVKEWYRRDEHALQSAEMLATIASLNSGFAYPVEQLYHAWLQMLLNMDRNTLWGSAGGMVFEHETSWCAQDRFEWVEKQSAATLEAAAQKLAGDGQAVSIFNPVNWQRKDPLRLKLPANTSLAGAQCEAAGDGTIFCQLEVPATGIIGETLKTTPAAAPKTIELPATIETRFYSAKMDPITGALVSLKTKPSGREMLGGPANVIVAEKHHVTGNWEPGDFTDPRPQRQRLATSSDFKAMFTATEGPIAITVKANSDFLGGGVLKRVTRFYKDSPRIEFETELNDIPNHTVVVTEFPLAQMPAEIRRSIPFGFSRDDGSISGIVPAIGWSDYTSPGKGGVTLLDRGVPGREINTNTPIIYLLNATDKYYGYTNAWLSGKGRHSFEYALVAHDQEWTNTRIPQIAWEYNAPVTVAMNCQPVKAQSFLQTSANVIVEAMRRDGSDIELRLVEAFGQSSTAEVKLNLPHTSAALTDLTGGHVQKLHGGPDYKFPVKPQQIVTLRFHTSEPVAEIKPLMAWDELVPEAKRAALHEYMPDKKGHPPLGK